MMTGKWKVELRPVYDNENDHDDDDDDITKGCYDGLYYETHRIP
jgi:hypothetical protein